MRVAGNATDVISTHQSRSPVENDKYTRRAENQSRLTYLRAIHLITCISLKCVSGHNANPKKISCLPEGFLLHFEKASAYRLDPRCVWMGSGDGTSLSQAYNTV